jgi:AcrR family transcriptional regulator
MAEPVKRTYSSTLRAEQARATRRAIVAAAAELFVRDGYGATTVDAIAAAAGVSRKTVFASVGGKAEALKLARDWAIVGDDEPIPMLERPAIRAAASERDARKLIAGYVRTHLETAARLAEIHHVIESAAGADDDLRALSLEGWQQRRSGMGKFAEQLGALGALHDGMSVETAGDLLWLYNDPETFYKLVIVRGWPVERFAAWLKQALSAQLIRPEYKAGSTSST